jgi:hypothetical protein
MLSRPAHDLTDEEGVHKSSRTLLQTFKSKDKWEQWRFKSRSKLIKAKIWNTTQYIRPIQPDMIQLTAIEQATLTAEQIVFNNNLAEGTPPDDTPIPTTRLENAQQLALRQLAWDTENQGLYDALVECVEDEPLQIVQGTTEGDGRSAWNELMKRYGNVTIASQLAIIKELFELKLKNGIEQHVTTWKASLRKLVEYNLIFGDPIIVVMFLQSLPATYSPFKTYSMMQPEINSTGLYLAVIEFARSNLTYDEANTSDIAMQAMSTQDGPCRFGNKCWNRDNGCPFTHHNMPDRPTNTYRVGKGQGKGQGKGGSGGWICTSCAGNNYNPTTLHCFQCKTGRYPGMPPKQVKTKANQGHPKRKHEQAHAVIAKKLKASNKALSALQQLNKKLRKPNNTEDEDDGTYVPFALVATEVFTETALTAHTGNSEIITFLVDSGASSHFAGSDVPITNMKTCDAKVQTAEGSTIVIKTKGTFTGYTPQRATLTFTVKKNSAFAYNLFSVKQATDDGYKFTFNSTNAFMTHTITGDIIPLEPTRSGWNLNLRKI